MEKHGLVVGLAALVVSLTLGCTGRTALRGAVPLSGDGQSSWIYVETTDPDRNGIWHCTTQATDAGPKPRCVKARMMTWSPSAGGGPAPASPAVSAN